MIEKTARSLSEDPIEATVQEALRRQRRTLEACHAARVAALEERVRRAEAATSAKSRYLAQMSHELRTPLNAIIGYAELMEEELAGELSPQFEADARRIVTSSRHLLRLVNDVLDLSKIEAERMELDYEFVDVAGMLIGARDSVQMCAQEAGVTLTLEIAPDLRPVWTDPLRVQQCLLNLASNACKFARGGQVSLAAKAAERDGKQWLELRVTDTGIGMSESELARLFTPFMQANAATARTYGGTGLGLAITKRLVDLLDGDIEVKSKEGEGSSFALFVPYQSAEPA
jgi:signal transduction histidine kinase